MDFVLYIILGIAIPWAVIQIIISSYNKYHEETIYYGTSERESLDPDSINEFLKCKKHNKGKALTITISEDCDAPDDDAVYHYIYSSYKPVVFLQ